MAQSFRETYAVTGYVPTDEVEKLHQRAGGGTVEVAPDHGVTDVVARVHAGDVTDVRVGSAKGGHTVVQLLLREGATVETVTRVKATPDGITRFHDPALQRLAASATAKVIEA